VARLGRPGALMSAGSEPPARKFPLMLGRLPGVSGGGVRGLLRPQRHAADAHADASSPRVSLAGHGLDSAGVRARMVERLRDGGATHVEVLRAFAVVPRHTFVDAGLANQSYEDTSLPIGHGQTISKPSVVARMLELLFDGANARRDGHLGAVLEIGTGCGYQAALLSELGRRVISVERLKPLHDKARSAGRGRPDRLAGGAGQPRAGARRGRPKRGRARSHRARRGPVRPLKIRRLPMMVADEFGDV